MRKSQAKKAIPVKRFNEEAEWEYLEEGILKKSRSACVCITDQYLKEKLFKDANTIVGQKKRNEFVNTLKEMNLDLPRSKVTRRILDMFDEGSLVISDQSIVEKGPKFPVVKLDV